MASNNSSEEREARKMRFIYPCFIDNQLDLLLNKVNDAQFGEIYACLSKRNKTWKGGSKAFKVFKDVVKKNTLTQFNSINKDVKLDEKLSTVDNLRSRYPSNKNSFSWRPDGDVEKTLVSHDMDEKLKRKAHLQRVVDKKMDEIEKLKTELNQICAQLKSEEELDEEMKLVNDEASNEMKNYHLLKQKLDEMVSRNPSTKT